MNDSVNPVQSGWILGIEGGGTRTSAIFVQLSSCGEVLQTLTAEYGPGNVRLMSDQALLDLFQSIEKRGRDWVKTDALLAVGIAMAGGRAADQHQRLKIASRSVWKNIPVVCSHDLESAWMAGSFTGDSSELPLMLSASNSNPSTAIPRVLTLSGTGSCVYGKTSSGKEFKIGGWGHLLGDKGSAYDIGLRALKAVVYYLDRDGEWKGLGPALLRRLQLNDPMDLIEWIRSAGKDEVADLAREVSSAAESGDRIANDILRGAASALAKDTLSCLRNLIGKEEPGADLPFEVILAGGTLLKCKPLQDGFRSVLIKSFPRAVIRPLQKESVWGAVLLAAGATNVDDVELNFSSATSVNSTGSGSDPEASAARLIPVSTDLSPTEKRNPRSSELDTMPLDEAVRLMIREENYIISALEKNAPEIIGLTQAVIDTFAVGGRLFYVGAGTSGRLGVLDASECPPTFRAHPEQVQGIIAGGQKAIWSAVEGAEDDYPAGVAAVKGRGVESRDLLVGIASSGRTPFVWGAIQAAREIGAQTGFICFNPNLEMDEAFRPDHWLALDLEPELLTGSTRLKSGTATKIILNILTTLGMVRTGKALSNLMVDLNPSNVKLRARAVRIVRELTAVDENEALHALEDSGWIVKEAVAMLQRKSD